MSKRERWSDDLMWSLQCAINDATDIDGHHQDALRAALEKHQIAVVPFDLMSAAAGAVDAWDRHYQSMPRSAEDDEFGALLKLRSVLALAQGRAP